jgi:hypothetical protein
LPERQLIREVERRFAPARVAAVQIFRQPNLAQVMQTADRRSVFVNPHDGSVFGEHAGRLRNRPSVFVNPDDGRSSSIRMMAGLRQSG